MGGEFGRGGCVGVLHIVGENHTQFDTMRALNYHQYRNDVISLVDDRKAYHAISSDLLYGPGNSLKSSEKSRLCDLHSIFRLRIHSFVVPETHSASSALSHKRRVKTGVLSISSRGFPFHRQGYR